MIKKGYEMQKILISLMILMQMVNASGGILPVKWPTKTNLQRKVEKSYPVKLKEKIKKVKLPVLLPKAYVFSQKMSIVSDKNYYTITIFFKGANLMVSGDRTYQLEMRDIDAKSQKMLKRVKQKFTRSEGMMVTDFSRYGVNYSLTLECDNFNQDKRCSNSDFLKKAYRDLVLVGGKR